MMNNLNLLIRIINLY